MKNYITHKDSNLQVIRNDVIPKAELSIIGEFDIYNLTAMKKTIKSTVGDMLQKGISGSILIHEKYNGVIDRIATISVEFHDEES